MRRLNYCVLLLALFFVSCVKHADAPTDFVPVATFSGRLLVMKHSHRFQVEVDWQSEGEKGHLRLTHALSGRIIHVMWEDESMYWKDNQTVLIWRLLTEKELLKLGIILPPWKLAKIFLGEYPSSMVTQNNRIWKGSWDGYDLKVKWGDQQQKVEIADLKHGRKVIVFFND